MQKKYADENVLKSTNNILFPSCKLLEKGVNNLDIRVDHKNATPINSDNNLQKKCIN